MSMSGKRIRRRLPLPTCLNPRQERFLNWLLGGLVACVTAAWTLGVLDVYGHQRAADAEAAPGPTQKVQASLFDPRSRSTAYLDDAALSFLDPLRGESGELRAVFRQPGAALTNLKPPDPELVARYEHEGAEMASDDFTAPDRPGVYKLAVEFGKTRQAIEDLRIVTIVPFTEKKGERIGLYYLGSWPFEKGGTPRSKAYANPDGFIEVTKENRDTYVSEHFQLKDFLTKDQFDVWPKYVVIDPRLLDKLELVVQELEADGHKVEDMFVMSGFRTPRYNRGSGNTKGRANLSRHMYGDAADIYVDNNRDGHTDDVNGDGRVDVTDSEVIARAAERVEAKHPALVGGIGIYKACCGHGPFTHIDVRGYRARWRGSGSG